MVRAPSFLHSLPFLSPLVALDIASTEPPGYTLLCPFCRRLVHALYRQLLTLLLYTYAYVHCVLIFCLRRAMPPAWSCHFCSLVCLRPYDVVCFACGAYFWSSPGCLFG